MPDSDPRYFLNGTMINMDQCDHTSCCTLDICPLDYAFINHIPSLGGTAFFVALFSLFLVLHILLGGYYRTWYFSISILCGLILEVLGYAGRLMMRSNPFNFSAFLLYLIPLTIGPAFMCAAIYVCLGRIVVVYGQHLSKLKPSTYTFLFVSSDFLSLLLQAAGGAVTSIAPDDNPSLRQSGINIMLAGLSLQVVSLVVFIILCGDFARRVLGQRGTGWDGEHRDVWGSRRFSFFLLALTIATITILVRSAFRVAELSQGFDGSLANDEVTFLVLEGTMVGIATIALTIGHPGYAFLGQWSRLTFAWSKKGEKSLPRKSVTSVDSQGETVERK